MPLLLLLSHRWCSSAYQQQQQQPVLDALLMYCCDAISSAEQESRDSLKLRQCWTAFAADTRRPLVYWSPVHAAQHTGAGPVITNAAVLCILCSAGTLAEATQQQQT
jgi:hypothetical protein